jgi:uncharacterized repeat protein (TIGR03803 family)
MDATKPILRSLLLILLALGTAGARVSAQTFTVLHTFTGGVDGAEPIGGLIMEGNTLYGTTDFGGSNNAGVVFSVTADGSVFTAMHSFEALTPVINVPSTNSEGSNPLGTLALGGNTLYGAAGNGGTNGWGTIFAVTTNGSNYQVLHTFAAYVRSTNSDGANPQGGLTLSGNTLYGAASSGGTNNDSGTLFSLDTNGSDFTVIHTFARSNRNTNYDGTNPSCTLIVTGGLCYGVAGLGGVDEYGTVFSCETNGTPFNLLYTLDGVPDGYNPFCSLALGGGALYGTAAGGGIIGWGTIFSAATNGEDFSVIYNFSPNSERPFTNGDGAEPHGAVTLAGNRLFGTAQAGGAYSAGTVYSIETNGSGFVTLSSFSEMNTNASGVETNLEGASPEAGVTICGNTLYGVTLNGGAYGKGVVFSLTLPALTITGIKLAGTTLVLSGINGLNGTNCVVLGSTNVALPLSQWTPLATNVAPLGGGFTASLTNAVNAAASGQFYTLEAQ